VEFIRYEEVLSGIKEQGIMEVEDEAGLTRFEIEPDDHLSILHVKSPQSTIAPLPEAHVHERDRDTLPGLVDELLGRLHLNEVLVVPVKNWRQIITTVAYDMADNEEWQEMDTISAMHQNTRNPLAIIRGETPVLISLIEALLKNAETPSHDLMITSDVSPLLIEIFHDGALSITCDSFNAEELIKSITE